jgi:probable HAF family extracellular repeat protein
LPGGDTFSFAAAISADGSTVVGSSSSAGNFTEAFYWTADEGLVGLGDLPGDYSYSQANAVSADGSVIVGGSRSAQGNEAFRWTRQDGMVGLGDLAGELFSSDAFGVSADGSIVVGAGNYIAGGGPLPVVGEAFRWTAVDGVTGLGDLPGLPDASRAFAISADGRVIVGKADAGSTFQVEDLGVAARWTADGLESLGFLPGGFSISVARDVSDDGSVIVGTSNVGMNHGAEAFRWSEDRGMVALPERSSQRFYSDANSVSADGSVIVGTFWDIDTNNSHPHAFIWDAIRGIRSLTDVLSEDSAANAAIEGWRLETATGVSADGQKVVGSGVNAVGEYEAWIVELDDRGDITPRAGDANADGVVNGSDLMIVRANLGIAGFWYHGDFDGDGIVSNLDVQITQSAIPEPATVLLGALAIGLVIISIARRRNRFGLCQCSKWLGVGLWFLVAGFPNPALALTQVELETMRDLWIANGSKDYNFFMQQTCFCPPDVIRPGLVEVRSGSITAVIDAETLQPLEPQEFLTIDGLFDELQTALVLPAFAIEAQFDAVLGYPTRISIDLVENLADDVVDYTARDLSLVPEPTTCVSAILGALGIMWYSRRESTLRHSQSVQALG